MRKLSWISGLNVIEWVLIREQQEHQNQTKRYDDRSKGQGDTGPQGHKPRNAGSL